MRFFSAKRSAFFFAHVERVPVLSDLEPGDMVAMDNLPPPAPCHVAQLFGIIIEEAAGIRMARAAGANPPNSS